MRQGELLALRWSDIRLLDAELTIGRTLVAGIGEQRRTKRGEGATRTIDLTADAVKVLEDWLTLSGAAPDSDGLVFARPDGGPLVGSTITRSVLYPAMGTKRAGIPREGEHGRKRTFHSLRHTYARLMLEAGAEITWVQGQLGHSSITLTVDTYGHWARSAEKAQATKMNGVLGAAL